MHLRAVCVGALRPNVSVYRRGQNAISSSLVVDICIGVIAYSMHSAIWGHVFVIRAVASLNGKSSNEAFIDLLW